MFDTCTSHSLFFSLYIPSLEAFLCTFSLPSSFTAPLMLYAFLHQCIHSVSLVYFSLLTSHTHLTHSYNFMWGSENNVYIMHSQKPGTHLCRISLCNETSIQRLHAADLTKKKRNIFCHLRPLRMIKVKTKKGSFYVHQKYIQVAVTVQRTYVNRFTFLLWFPLAPMMNSGKVLASFNTIFFL